MQNYDLYQFSVLFFNVNVMYRVCKRLRTPLYSECHPIGLRSESDWVAYGIRLGGVRNPIGRRTVHDDGLLSIKD